MPGLRQPMRDITFLPDGTASVTAWPITGGPPNVMAMPLTKVQYDEWQCGGYIQNVLPHLTADQREFLLSGLTPEMWDAMFKEKED